MYCLSFALCYIVTNWLQQSNSGPELFVLLEPNYCLNNPKKVMCCCNKRGSYAAAVQPRPHDYQRLVQTKLCYWTRGSPRVLILNIV